MSNSQVLPMPPPATPQAHLAYLFTLLPLEDIISAVAREACERSDSLSMNGGIGPGSHAASYAQFAGSLMAAVAQMRSYEPRRRV